MNSTTLIRISDIVKNATTNEPVKVINFIEGFLILVAVLTVLVVIITCIEKICCIPTPPITRPSYKSYAPIEDYMLMAYWLEEYK